MPVDELKMDRCNEEIYLKETVRSQVRVTIPGVTILHVEGEEKQKAPKF